MYSFIKPEQPYNTNICIPKPSEGLFRLLLIAGRINMGEKTKTLFFLYYISKLFIILGTLQIF